ncbi:hypothetical protein DKT68_05490 [Micromonospora acroterricola]|uniref:Uncharacterized protein n=1 Tax=Micromonospora acroterricola TaxID=2202421 RepID=A0A317DFI6_9ACTN|nr:hypothetical protein [Micromonospora acroterricola]PWR11545.1 hypothetical protein DKT68_05490 [Micromonospora acroterricola]
MTAHEGRSGGGDRLEPEATEPWKAEDGFDAEPPWGTDEDSPMDEGSEETAVPEGRRGDRRAGAPAGPSDPAGRHGFGSVEPTRTPAAGPGAPPDPAPSRRSFPDDADINEMTQDALRSRGRRS